MLFKSLILSEASGSVGGLTYSHNSAGMYIRKRVVPVDPGSPEQVVVRGAFEFLANMWRNTLTAAQRAGWITYAANVAMKNKLGATIFLSGLAHFIRSNVEGKVRSSSVVGDAPTVFNLGDFTTPTVANFVAGPPSTVDVAYNAGDTWYTSGVPANAKLRIYASRPQDPTIQFFKGPYRYCAQVAGGVASPLSVTLPFAAVAGQRIFFAARALCSDGRLSDLRTFRLDT